MIGAVPHAINWLEILAWCGLTVLLLTLLGAVIRYTWGGMVRRVETLETWRENHQQSDTGLQLQIRDLQNETKNHTAILERMEKTFAAITQQIQRVAMAVGTRRGELGPWMPDDQPTMSGL